MISSFSELKWLKIELYLNSISLRVVSKISNIKIEFVTVTKLKLQSNYTSLLPFFPARTDRRSNDIIM
jgi:hypothetical protein